MKKAFLKYWNKILDLGTSSELDTVINKQIRIVNLLALIGVISYALFTLQYLFDGIGITSTETTLAVFILAVALYLNHKGYYITAKYYLTIVSVGMVTTLGILHGPQDSANYWLYSICVIALMYIDKKIPLIFFFLLNVVCFWVVRYVHDTHGLILYDGNELYHTNLIQQFIVLFLIAYSFKRVNLQHEELLNLQKETLENEKDRSDSLLTNILPEEVAEELKSTGTNVPQYFEMSTVVFTNFKDFIPASLRLSPSELIDEVNEYFTAFDNIIERYGLEKIKTIGDAYMCVGGVPIANQTNPEDAVNAALEMQEFVIERKRQRAHNDAFYFEMRIGIHTGPVVAGVIGKSKFAYDIWGDTVNTAARMESTCEVGKINISQFTYEHIKDKYDVISRGKVEAKHKGLMDMYYVLSRKEKLEEIY